MVARDSKPENPDGSTVLDLDRGSSGPAGKLAEQTELGEFEGRADERAGLRELDEVLEGMPGLTRAQKDRDRISPRATTDELGHPLMRRRLPTPDAVRKPFSSRQKKARSKARQEAARQMPRTQQEAQERMLEDADDERLWESLNDQLSNSAGDVQALEDKDRAFLGQLDRSIQTAERQNDRGHVIYANVELSAAINRSNIASYVDTELPVGTEVSFDRYTLGSHQMHETATWMDDPGGRVVMCEIETRRGAYLGHSDSKDDTSHLLPRNMKFEIVGHHTATYEAPDGTTGQRFVVQLHDITPEI